jgi:uncharacterized protein involved in outer membrane biogenesis
MLIFVTERQAMRWLLKLVLFLAALVAIVILTSDFWGFWLIKGYLMRLGYGCTAEQVHIGFWPPRVDIEDLVVTNPKDFPDLRGVRVSRLKLEVPYKTLLGQGHRVHEVVLEIPELVIVRAESGELNWARLQPPKTPGERPHQALPGERPSAPPVAKSGSRMKSSAFYGVKLDRLKIKLGLVEYRDYRVAAGTPPKVITTDLQVDKTYQPVPNLPMVLAGLGLEISLKAGPSLQQILDPPAEGASGAGSGADGSRKEKKRGNYGRF